MYEKGEIRTDRRPCSTRPAKFGVNKSKEARTSRSGHAQEWSVHDQVAWPDPDADHENHRSMPPVSPLTSVATMYISYRATLIPLGSSVPRRQARGRLHQRNHASKKRSHKSFQDLKRSNCRPAEPPRSALGYMGQARAFRLGPTPILAPFLPIAAHPFSPAHAAKEEMLSIHDSSTRFPPGSTR